MKAIVFHLFKAALIVGALVFLRGERPVPAPAVRADTIPPVGYANPAAIYCGGLGYSFEVQHTLSGDVGTCKFPDSSTCDAWDFLAGKCGVKYSVCSQQGYGLRTRTDGNNAYAPEYAVCTDGAGKQVATVAELAKLEEKATKTGCTKRPPVIVEQDTATQEFVGTLPASFDWRYQSKGNYLTNVRDQGQCGSCWAFSAVGVTEAALNIANDTVGNNYDLSEQYLVSDCSGAGTCCGGWASEAMDYIKTSGIPDEGCMAYVDGNYDGGSAGCQCYSGCGTSCLHNSDSQCSDKTCGDRCTDYATRLTKFKSTGPVVATRATIKNLLITKGPLSVSLSMDGSWNGDLYQCAAGSPVNHAIVLVGYNDAGSYWIVKNSWGSSWNGDGYFKVGYGQCSIENDIYYGSMVDWVPAAHTPIGTSNVNTPTYTWSAITSATQYQYEVMQGAAVIHTYTVDSSACDSTTCTDTPADVLAYAPYTWHVQAYVNSAWRGYSASQAFTVADPRLPILKGPSGTIVDKTPTYSWASVVGATSYQYQVLRGTAPVYTKTVAPGVCGPVNCTNTPTTLLSLGTYKWRARAMVGGVWQSYAAYKSFTVANGFSSQFNGNAANWVKRPGAPWVIGSTTYHTNGVEYKASSVSYNKTYTNFTYQARVKRVTTETLYGGQVGLEVRGTPIFGYDNDWKTGYQFVYSSYYGQFIVWRGVNGSWTTLKSWTSSPAIVTNGWNTLKVVANGSSLKFYINGRLVWSGWDSRLTSGQVGIWDWSGGSLSERLDVDWATLSYGAPPTLVQESVEAGQTIPAIMPANPPNR